MSDILNISPLQGEKNNKIMKCLSLICFELGKACNLGQLHPKCPNLNLERFAKLDTSKELDDETIIECAIKAYKNYNFQGFIAWHYYNEPCLQKERMHSLMKKIKENVPESRFLLWTNGTKIKEVDLHDFDYIIISSYFGNDDEIQEALNKYQKIGYIWHNPTFDDRLESRNVEANLCPCIQILESFTLDAYGNHHPCCYDWQGELSVGNVFKAGFDELVARSKKLTESLLHMTNDTHDKCLKCKHKNRVVMYDNKIGQEIAQRTGIQNFKSDCVPWTVVMWDDYSLPIKLSE